MNKRERSEREEDFCYNSLILVPVSCDCEKERSVSGHSRVGKSFWKKKQRRKKSGGSMSRVAPGEVSVTLTPLVDNEKLEKSYIVDVCLMPDTLGDDGMEAHHGPVASLLLDCGWSAPYGEAEDFLGRYKGILLKDDVQNDLGGREISGILISHPDQEHMGGLPYIMNRDDCCVNSGKIFITGAAHKMGQMVAYDAYLNAHASNIEPTPFNLDDIDDCFKDMVQMRYRQEATIFDNGRIQIRVTPYPSGRVVGGAIWKIHVGGACASHDILYAVDYNHKREIHLMGGAMMEYASMLTVSSIRPALLITDAHSLDTVPVPVQYTKNEKILIDVCLSSLRAEGNVLIPVDAAGRLLEILLLLNRYWKEKNLTYPLAALGPMMHTTLDFARSQLEWMNEDLVKSLGHTKVENPLALKCVTPCTSIKDVKKLSRGPKVIIATSDSLEDGHSRTLFTWWANQAASAIILALEPKKGSLAERIYQMEQNRYHGGRPAPVIEMNLSKRVPLKGKELEEWNAAQNKKENALEDDKHKIHKGIPVETEEAAVEDPAITPGQGSKHVKKHNTPQQGQISSAKRSNVAVIEHASRDGADIDAFRINNPGHGVDMDLDKDDNDACLIEGFELGMDVAGPMFPDEDDLEGIQYDEYGAIVDLQELDQDTSGGNLGRALASEAAAERYITEGGDEPEDVLEPEVPTKIETKELRIEVAARVVRLDFDGRSDGASVQTILAQMAPRTCIIVQGSDSARSKLASNLMKDLEGLNSHIFAPVKQETISICLGPARSAIMSDELFQGIHMHPMGDCEIGWVDAEMGNGSGGASADLPNVMLNQGADMRGDSGRGGVFIGDVKLSQLKRALARADISAEFHGGGLYCDGNILVKRQGDDGGIVIEGSLCDQYFKIRDIVYSQYHVC